MACENFLLEDYLNPSCWYPLIWEFHLICPSIRIVTLRGKIKKNATKRNLAKEFLTYCWGFRYQKTEDFLPGEKANLSKNLLKI
jgi:hypothetical protein